MATRLSWQQAQANKADKQKRVDTLKENFPPGTLMLIKQNTTRRMPDGTFHRILGYATVKKVNANGTMTLDFKGGTIKTEYQYQSLTKDDKFWIVGLRETRAIPV